MHPYPFLAAALCVFLCACGISADNPSDSFSPGSSTSISSDFPEADENGTLPTTEVPAPVPALPEDNDVFVCVREYIPSVVVDLKYATTDNFTGEIIYDFTDAYLRAGTVKKLQKVANMLDKDGYSLKIWDAFRPPAAQFKLWEICPDPTYVSNPNSGYSSHSRGNTLDITLVDAYGNEVEMPTGFDDFSALADRDYSDVNSTAGANALYLETVMTGCGFKAYSGEWWHFSDTDPYDAEESFLSGQIHPASSDPFIGNHTGLEDGENTLQISKQHDGTYYVSVSLYRLTLQDDGIGTCVNNILTFTATDASGHPMIWEVQSQGNTLLATVVDSTWELLPTGSAFSFS